MPSKATMIQKPEDNILAYAFKSDDGQRPNTLKPGNEFLGGASLKN
jgi:hypothetical protein